MKQIRYSEHEGFDLFNHGVESVVYVRCTEHRASPQINDAEAGWTAGECGECVRQQCWKDMLALIARAIEDTSVDTDERDVLAAFEESLVSGGIGTFGVADELEADHNAATARLHVDSGPC